MLIRMAWKNLARYKKRTLITAFAIAIGVMFSIAIEALLAGLDQQSYRNLISYETSAMKVYATDYYPDRLIAPVDRLIDGDQRLRVETVLEEAQLVYTPRFQSMAEVYFLDDSFPASGSMTGMLIGVDPVSDTAVFSSGLSVEEGSWLSPGEDGIVIGGWLAHDMQAQVGYYVTIQTKGKDGFIQTLDVPILGIIQSDNPVVNSTAMYMDLSYLDEMLELEGHVSEYAIAPLGLSVIKGADAVSKQAQAVEGKLSGLEVYGWDALAIDEVTLAQTKGASSRLIVCFMFIIAAVGISNTMLMAVMERKDEVGMLKALGYTDMRVTSLFTLEGVFIGLLGCAVGLVAGIAITYPMVVQGLDFSSLLDGVNIGYRVSGIMKAAWDAWSFLFVCIGALVVSALSAWLAVRRIVKTEIASIFRAV